MAATTRTRAKKVSNAGVQIEFVEKKPTKRTKQYEEVSTGAPKIGTIYFQKEFLKELGCENGEALIVTVAKKQ